MSGIEMEATPTEVMESIAIEASPAAVWSALTDPVKIGQWLSPKGATVLSDWRVGSPIVFVVKYLEREVRDHGTILALEAERLFRYSHFTSISRLPDSPESYTEIEFRLTPESNRTILRLTHRNLIAFKAYEHSRFYWSVTLHVIKKLVEGG